MNRGKAMLLIMVYVALSTVGLLFLKIGTQHELELKITSGVLNIRLNAWIIAGLCIYIVSFITSIIAMRSINLSVFYPVSAGLSYIVICILSFIVLKEVISVQQFIGMMIILIGIIVMNLRF